MGLLAPLYALAALAVVGPILFHLIRRQPKGRIQFSSLLFLSPTPPQLTSRSRLDNWLLLLLRTLALILIAFAFARPYFRQASRFDSDLTGRNIAIMLDTSGSMQREEVWASAIETIQNFLEELSERDRVSLFTCDSNLRTVVPFSNTVSSTSSASNLLSEAESIEAVSEALETIRPSWTATNLAVGLTAIADLITSQNLETESDSASHQILLVTDLHEDCGVDELQGYPWPEDLYVDVRQIRPAIPGNARASLLENSTSNSADKTVSLRIENNSDSQTQDLSYGWTDGSGSKITTEMQASIPAGQVRVVELGPPPVAAAKIVIAGDAWAADNAIELPSKSAEKSRIICLEAPLTENTQRLAYFLEQAPLSTKTLERSVETATSDAATSAEFAARLLDGTTDAVVVDPVWLSRLPQQETVIELLKKYCAGGGTVIVSLSNQNKELSLKNTFLSRFLEDTSVSITATSENEFQLISYVDFSHPIFAPFAAPQFSDFSKIRIWQNDTISFNPSDNTRALARLEDGNAWLLEHDMGRGTVWIFTSSWRTEDSNFALSTKFVPVLLSMLNANTKATLLQRIEVGESLPILENAEPQVFNSEGEDKSSLYVSRENRQIQITEPGLFQISDSRAQGAFPTFEVAVEIPGRESRLTPVDSATLEQFGVQLGVTETATEQRDRTKQRQTAELEKSQKLWQWLIAACLVVLFIETLVSAKLSSTAA